MRPLHRLRALRERASLSQKELADRAGVLRQTIVTLEGGRGARAQQGTARKLAGALGVAERILYGDPERPGAESFTVFYERGERGTYLASCAEIPGAAAKGRSPEEALCALRETTRSIVRRRREQGFRLIEGRPGASWEPFGVDDE